MSDYSLLRRAAFAGALASFVAAIVGCDGSVDITIDTATKTTGMTAVAESALVWPDTRYDFGEVSIDDGAVQLEHAFLVTNPSFHSLRVEKIVTSCGCAKAELDVKEIRAGDSATLRATIEVNGVGNTEQSARVAFSDGSTATFWLRAIGTRSTQLHVIPMRQRLTGETKIIHVRLQTIDRTGRVETGEPTAKLEETELPITFSGWTTLEAQNDVYQRPLRQSGELEIDLGEYSGTYPIVIRITTASALAADITVDRFD